VFDSGVLLFFKKENATYQYASQCGFFDFFDFFFFFGRAVFVFVLSEILKVATSEEAVIVLFAETSIGEVRRANKPKEKSS